MLVFFPLERIRVELAKSSVSDSGYRGKSGKYRGRKDDDHRLQPRETFTQCFFRLHEERSLYKGSSHIVTTLTISNAIFFYALNFTKRWLTSMHHQQQSGGKNHLSFCRLFIYLQSKVGKSLTASIIAGCINVMTTNPLWVASLRIMESKPPEAKQALQQQNLWNVMIRIIQNEGLLSLWNGTSTSLLLVSNPVIQHFIYEQLRLLMLGRRRELRSMKKNDGRSVHIHEPTSLSFHEAFIFGAIAKTVATVVTYPLQLAQVLIRLRKNLPSASNTYGDHHDPHNSSHGKIDYYSGTLSCLRQQFSSGGIQALFQGMNAKLLQTVLTAALTFLTYEQMLVLLGLVYKKRILFMKLQ